MAVDTVEHPSGLRVVDGLVDTALERSIAAQLIERPDLLHEYSHPDFGLDCLADFHALAVVKAIANLLERKEKVNAGTVAVELETDGMQSVEVWYPTLVGRCPDVIRPDLYRAQTASLVRLAAKRKGVVTEGDRLEYEIDEFALRDAEPAPVDPWAAELARAAADVAKAIGERSAAERKPLFGIDATHLLAMDFPPTQWQVTGLVTRGGTVVVAGEPKAGVKTWLLIEGALAIATGTRMCGEFFSEKGVAAIFFAEDKAQAVRNRLRALIAGTNRTLEPGRLHLQPRGEFIDILKDEDLAWIVASARRLPKLDLLVLDPLRDIHTAAEDKSDEMSPVMKRLRLLGELLGCTIWISHHTPKANKDTSKRRAGQNMRGSSAIHGSIDSGIYIEPLDADGTNLFRAAVTSQIKDARSFGTFELELAIVDDESGAARRASWALSRPEAKDDEGYSVLAWIADLARDGNPQTVTDLRKHEGRPNGENGKPIPERRMVQIIRRLIDSRKVTTNLGRVVPIDFGGTT